MSHWHLRRFLRLVFVGASAPIIHWETLMKTSYKTIRIIFYTFTHVCPSKCMLESQPCPVRIFSGFNLRRHSSTPLGINACAPAQLDDAQALYAL
ncbi:hypothetical protein ACTXT7_001792, partial [Hymenolepis weldensis]